MHPELPLPKAKSKKLSYRAKIAKLYPHLKFLPKVIWLLRPCLIAFLILYPLKFTISAIDLRKTKFIGDFADIISGNRDYLQTPTVLFHLAICYTLYMVISWIYQTLQEKTVQRLNDKVKKNLYRNLLEKDLEFFDQTHPSDAIEAISIGVDGVQNVATKNILKILNPLLKIFGILSLLKANSPDFTFIALLLTPFVFFFYEKPKSRIKRTNSQAMNLCEAEVADYSKDRFLLIKSFSTEGNELKQFIEKAKKCDMMFLKPPKSFWRVRFVQGAILLAFQLFLVAFAAMMVYHKKITLGTLVTLNLYFIEFFMSLNSVFSNFKHLLQSLSQSERLFKIIEYEPTVKLNESAATKKESIRGSIMLRRISFWYPSLPGLILFKNLTLEIKAGESIGFVGPSRSGKTTLLHLILRLYDVSEGKIYIGGENIKNYDVAWLHSIIGYVTQTPTFIHSTIEQNLTYGSTNVNKDRINQCLTLANADFLRNSSRFPLGLSTKFKEGSQLFSTSEKQRIAIARALIKDPKVILLDEVTANLDPQGEFEVQVAIENLVQLKNKTVIFTAKDQSQLRYCEKIYTLGEGKILEENSGTKQSQTN